MHILVVAKSYCDGNLWETAINDNGKFTPSRLQARIIVFSQPLLIIRAAKNYTALKLHRNCTLWTLKVRSENSRHLSFAVFYIEISRV